MPAEAIEAPALSPRKRFLTEAKMRLEQTREKLRASMRNAAVSLLPSPDTDPSDRGSYAQDQDNDVLTAERVAQELAMIEDALERIQIGEYGDCGSCGNKIPERRLNALPYVDYCVTCQQETEGENSR